jgi:hypothetical protein
VADAQWSEGVQMRCWRAIWIDSDLAFRVETRRLTLSFPSMKTPMCEGARGIRAALMRFTLHESRSAVSPVYKPRSEPRGDPAMPRA